MLEPKEVDLIDGRYLAMPEWEATAFECEPRSKLLRLRLRRASLRSAQTRLSKRTSIALYAESTKRRTNLCS